MDEDHINTTEYTRENRYKPKNSRLLGVGLAFLFASAAFFSGLQIGVQNTDLEATNLEAGIFSIFLSTPKPEEDVDFTKFWRVWNLLEEKFVSSTTTEAITKEERVNGAIDGLVKSYGDPYTVFLPPLDAAQFEQDISGNFGGVGMEIGIRDGILTVIAPLPDTPAEEAGILAGDVIIRIDGGSTEGMSTDEAVHLIRGERGTEVALTIIREGEAEFLEIAVTRDIITIPTIDTEVRGDIFIIRLYNFNAISELKMQGALREYVKSSADKIILDLRGNPGGFLQSSVAIAGFFLPTGKVVVRESFGEGKEEELHRSQGKTLGPFAPKDMVVLIDGGSASASEILAGALGEHDIATLIGATTFGKGSVQELLDLPDGASIKITIARWLTPDGISISDGGLTPDIEVERTPQDRLDNIDPQLDAAIEFLNR